MSRTIKEIKINLKPPEEIRNIPDDWLMKNGFTVRECISDGIFWLFNFNIKHNYDFIG
jgi:hypothetical protein